MTPNTSSSSSSSSCSSAKPCYLLNLPAELRNHILKYALVDDDHVLDVSTPSFRIPGLLTTTRQIRSETLPLYYSQNTFLFTCSHPSSSALLDVPDATIRLFRTPILGFCPGTITFFTGEAYTDVAFGRPDGFWDVEIDGGEVVIRVVGGFFGWTGGGWGGDEGGGGVGGGGGW